MLSVTDLVAGRKLILVGGKGGVGKTTVASAVAMTAMTAGARVLLVSTDPAHNLGHLWQVTAGDDPVTVVAEGDARVDVVEIDPHATIDRHLDAVLGAMREALPERLHGAAKDHIRRAREAPGTHEAAVLERLADVVESSGAAYDLVVVDTAPTGHTLRLLSLPGQLGGWVDRLLENRRSSSRFAAALAPMTGRKKPPEDPLQAVLRRRRERFAALERDLRDAERTAFVAVCVPEPVPAAETVELAASLRESGLPLAALIANRCAPDSEAFTARRAAEEDCLRDLSRAVPDVPLLTLPLVEPPLTGAGMIRRVAEAGARTRG